MAEERLRRNLDIALDPGPEFPSHLWLSRTMAALDRAGDRVRNDWQPRGSHRLKITVPRLGIWLAAALALVLLAFASVGAFIAINQFVHRSVPVHPAPFRVKSPGSAVCFSGCQVEQVNFVSASVGFVLEGKSVTPCTATCPQQPISLFRTTDAGLHWSQLNISTVDCCQAQLISSPDGNQLLLFGSSNSSTVLRYSNDAGVNWTSHGLPEGAGLAAETGCKGGQFLCTSATIAPLVYFDDPHDGWVVSQEQSFNIADLYRTTNAGANWTLVGKIDVNQQFGLDLVAGTPMGNGTADHALSGQFIFHGSSVAWFAPRSFYVPGYGSNAIGKYRVFRSADGGLQWASVDLVRPARVAASDPATMTVLFFDDRRGVLELVVNPPNGGGILEELFVYSTSDGGHSWSSPISVPDPTLYAEMRFIDPQHWVAWPAGGGWIGTSDAGQHWTMVPSAMQFGDPPAAGQGLPPQLPDNYPLNDQFGFVDVAHGWALPYQTAGDPNARGVALYLTNDGGKTWRRASLPELA